MSETLDTANESKKIRFEIEELKATQQLILQKDAKELREGALALFRSDSALARIYAAIDGRRTQQQLVAFVNANGGSTSDATVSRRVDKLEDAGLIEKVRSDRKGVVWSKNQTVEKLLKLTKALTDEGLLR
jgi:DNA-binding transcriptional ArsR family regulator